MLNNQREYDLMSVVERQHWWYRFQHYLVNSTLKASQISKSAFILDAGCGTGGLLKNFQLEGYLNVSGFDISQYAVDICVKSNLDVKLASISQLGLMNNQAQINVLTCLDALYYLQAKERKKFFSDAYSVLVPGGLLIINLPALDLFRGSHDRAVGISHRFTIKEIRELGSVTGFKTKEIFYWPFLFSPLIFLVRTLQRTKHKRNFLAVQSDLKNYPDWLNSILYNLLRVFDSISRARFIGSSLYAVFQRPFISAES